MKIKRISIIESIHFFLIVLLIVVTSFYVRSENLNLYLLFSLSFSSNVIYSLRNILYNKKGDFFYLFSMLLFLGFVNKFSLHTIFQYDYLEPLGGYKSTISSEAEVLLVSMCGSIGLLLAQFLSSKICFKKSENSCQLITNNKIQIFLVFLAIILSLINLKFNILLFGRVPSMQIPFKGNAIYFLILTRGLLFLHFYYLSKKINLKNVLIGGFIATVCSIGVLSRAVTILYFCTIFLIIMKKFLEFKNIEKFRVCLIFIATFLIYSAITVKTSTDLRTIYYNAEYRSIESKTRNISSIESSFKMYLQLVVDRWIGTEGVMSVVGYPEKGFRLLFEGFSEGSYNGVSFFSKISDPVNHQRLSKTTDRKVISTSVPGPIAFSYYSGSMIFTGIFLLVTCSLINLIVTICGTYLKLNDAALTYIAVFLTFDFIQFGIAPLSLIRNWLFTFLVIFLFTKIIKKINSISVSKALRLL